jgi:hypothetical protein
LAVGDSCLKSFQYSEITVYVNPILTGHIHYKLNTVLNMDEQLNNDEKSWMMDEIK